MPAKQGSSKAIWWIVGCALVPVVIGFVGIIAAILIPNFLDALQKAKQKRTMADLQTIGQAVETYKAQQGFAPDAKDIDALLAELGSSPGSVRRVDAWQHPFRYGCWQVESASGCDHYRIVSGGRDGRFDQEDLKEYEPGEFDRNQYDRDIVFGDGFMIATPSRRVP